MATSKSGGSTSNGRDSIGKRLGVKLYGGRKYLVAKLLYVNEEQKFIQVRM